MINTLIGFDFISYFFGNLFSFQAIHSENAMSSWYHMNPYELTTSAYFLLVHIFLAYSVQKSIRFAFVWNFVA